MGENKNSDSRKIEKLALIAESLQNLFQGRSTVIFELENEEYSEMISYFREIDRHHKEFSIDMSGTEFHFILSESFSEEKS